MDRATSTCGLAPRTALWLFLLSLLLRLGGVAALHAAPEGRHRLVTIDAENVYLPFARSESPVGESLVAPAYPGWLRLLDAAWGGPAPLWLQGVGNAVLRASVTVMVAALATRVAGPATGLVAGLIQAADTWEMFWSGFLLKEAVALPVSVAAVLLVVRLLEPGRGVTSAALAGAWLALATLARYPSAILLPWALVLVTWLPGREARPAACLRLGLVHGFLTPLLALALLGWSPIANGLTLAHNTLAVNDWSPASSVDTSGYTTASPAPLQSPAPRGQASVAPDRTSPFAFPRWVTSALWDTFTGHLRALVFALEPGRMLRKSWGTWRPSFEAASTGNLLALGLPYVLTLAAAAWGGRAAAGRGGQAWIPLSLAAVYVGMHLVLAPGLRFRQYAMPYVAILAAMGVVDLHRRYAGAAA